MRVFIVCLLLFASGMLQAAENDPLVLQNEYITAEFDGSGLALLHDKALGRTVQLRDDAFSITIDGKKISNESLKMTLVTQMQHRVAYAFKNGGYAVKVEYELQPGWRFISKQLFYGTNNKEYRVDDITVFRAELKNTVENIQQLTRGAHAVLLRLKNESGNAPGNADWGMFVVLQNPFLKWQRNGKQISASYSPEMDWKKEYGLYASDRCCIGIYGLSGTRYPFRLVREWEFVPPGSKPESDEYIDAAEMKALADCVRAHLLFSREKSVRVHIGWCENDYQIDTGTPEGQVEYKRIIAMAGDIGCDNILFTPRNTKVSSRRENRDAWGWEEVLWLNLGQKIRRDEWDIQKNPLNFWNVLIKDISLNRSFIRISTYLSVFGDKYLMGVTLQ